MNLWIIGVITIGLLAVAGIVVANTDTVTAEEPTEASCSASGNTCSADSNCGLQSCGAVQKTGGCGCGR